MTHKLFYFLGTLILAIAFIFNMRHSLDNYGFLTNSLMLELFAETSSSEENTSTMGTLTYVCTTGVCYTESFNSSHGVTTIKCLTEKPPKGMLLPRDVISWTSITLKCVHPTIIGANSNCEFGTRRTYFLFDQYCQVTSSGVSQTPTLVNCPKR